MLTSHAKLTIQVESTSEGRAQNRRVVFTIQSGGDDVKVRVQGVGDDTK